MAERDGGAQKAAPPPPPPQPTIALPHWSSMEGLFRGSGAADVSPGPMTLVSSFFAEDPDSEYRCLSQLLAGAIDSPVAPPPSRPPAGQLAAPTEGDTGREEGMGLRQNHSPLVAATPGLSLSSLLESPAGLTSSNLGYFGISHQQAPVQVTSQAVESHSYVHVQAEYPSLSAASTSLTLPPGSSINMSSLQQMPPLSLDTNNATIKSANGFHSDHKSQPAALIVDKPADDGYNWRKYGQKQVKGGEYPRSYYRCTHPKCPVKKKVERSLEGQVTEIIYKGQHNHLQPSQNRRSKEGGTLPSGCNELNGSFDFPTYPETGTANFSRSTETMSKRDRDSSHWTPVQLSDSSEGEGDGEPGTDEGGDTEQDPKRRNMDTRVMESTSHKTVTEPRIIVQTTSEVDLLDDGYRWRKYGQKVVKGNAHPRSYYRCTNAGCNVRKQIERASTDPKAVITTYEGKHNHDVPAARNSSHATANAGAATSSIPPNAQNASSSSQPSFQETEFCTEFMQTSEWVFVDSGLNVMQTLSAIMTNYRRPQFNIKMKAE
ncbi:putative WRKY transcription factor 4 [Cocos nucifera]|uniref:Putative WRKY transcription factor 4 n=2 Tax=Cocos nucifera TaxID=13894 RepID=A0A8K0N3C3_COCNU|nr:putative WRKY transcription factor 4 [Cocos nucifera]